MGLTIPAAIAVVLALASWRFARGRWQLVPLIFALAVSLIGSLIWLNEQPPVWVSVVVVLLVILGLLVLYWSPLPNTPEPSGKHGVGIRVVEIASIDASINGRSQAHIWYPTNETSCTSPRKFFSRDEARVYSGALRALGGPGFLQNHFQLANTHSYEDAAPANGQFPLVVFNHGGAMWPTTNFSLMEELASHGFIACSISHPGESAGVLWSDGSSTSISTEYVKSLQGNTDGIGDHANYILCQDLLQKRTYLPTLKKLYKDTLTSTTKRWAAHSIMIVDWLLGDKPQGSEADIASRIDRDKIAYCGMSLGGSVAHECCYLDARAAAGINLDGMNWTFNRIDTDIPVPFLQLYGDPSVSNSEVAAKADASFELPKKITATMTMYNDFYYESPDCGAGREDVLRVLVPGTAHMAFTDLALTARGPMRKLAGIGHADGRRTAAAVNELCRVFLTDAFDRKGFERSKSLATDTAAFVLQSIEN